MAVSAYKGKRLKKNPLLGTALSVDKGRGQERASFKRLYGEAKTHAASGRRGMEGRLASRYARFAKPNQRALGALGTQYKGFQAEAATYRDPETEKKMGLRLAAAKPDSPEYFEAEADRDTYERDIAGRISLLQSRAEPVARDIERRSDALIQRINDYNLFLGQA